MSGLVLTVVLLSVSVALLLLACLGAYIESVEQKAQVSERNFHIASLQKLIATLEQRPTLEQFAARDQEIRRLRNQIADLIRRGRGHKFQRITVR